MPRGRDQRGNFQLHDVYSLLISYYKNQTYIAEKTKACLLSLIQHLPNLAHLKWLVFNLWSGFLILLFSEAEKAYT